MISLYLTVFLIASSTIYCTTGYVIDLCDATKWRFFSMSNASITYFAKSVVVPGDIYTDLAPILKRNPLFGNNDLDLRWIAKEKWTYARRFYFSPKILKRNAVLLHVQGLDTVANVFLNDNILLSAKNQFLGYDIYVNKYLAKSGYNRLRIEFLSPIKAADEAAAIYTEINSHGVPPDCTNNVQNGECRVNFLRKIQSSFSWDWGPAFPTVGIWRPIFLEVFSIATIITFSPIAIIRDDKFTVDVYVKLHIFDVESDLKVTLAINELNILADYNLSVCNISVNAVECKFSYSLPKNLHVNKWCPNGYGPQKLYEISIALKNSDDIISSSTKSVGFREVKLIENLVNPNNSTKGRHFFFEINNVPIFLKGSNWIPISAFPAQNHTRRLRFLFQSMANANFNAIRVWGGGRYESEEFYSLADEYGILVWQDFMFACSLYPVDTEFLVNVAAEIQFQIYSIRNHPSIFIYSSNNENELGLYKDWFYENTYNKAEMIRDYIKLYRDTIRPLTQRIDPSRPFVLSSPSNGALADKGIQFDTMTDDPNDELYGDIHFYDEKINLWNSSNFKIPRCATEFGVQSFPLSDTLHSWIDRNELWYGSKTMTSRQHHPAGILTLLYMIANHFDVSINMTTSGVDFEKIIFLTQIHQSIALQAQVEHYRRWRGIIGHDGRGNTMCAMFWQLNDIWSAPSWSSIDFDLRWKPAHYFAKRFFQPLLFSMYLSDDRKKLNVYVVSDLTYMLRNIYMTLSVFVLGSGDFTPIYTNTINVQRIHPLKSERLNFNPNFWKLTRTANKRQTYSITADDLVFRIDAVSQNPNVHKILSEKEWVLLPNSIRSCRLEYESCVDGSAFIETVRKVTESEFEITIAAVRGVVPIVWIEFHQDRISMKEKFENADEKILYLFSDNAFTMTEPNRAIRFYVDSPSELDITADNFTINFLPRQMND